MFSTKSKYVSISTENPEDENLNPRKHIVTPACFWTSFRTIILLSIYFIPSIGLTFYQRWLLQTFHFPLSIVLCHLVVKFTLASLIRTFLNWKNKESRVTLNWYQYCRTVAATGIASGIDVGLSNWGLEFITITLYTLTKSTTIVFILGCAILFKLEKKSWSLCVIVVMISIGLILFTYKATQFDLFGFVLVLIASFSSGLRWTSAQLLLQKSRLGLKNPIDMVYHVQPWMIVAILPFTIAIEGQAVISSCRLFRYTDWSIMMHTIAKISAGAFLAFIMECSEFLVVTYTSSLTLSIGGIFKDIFILILAVEWNGDEMSPMNALGLLVCLCGIISHVVHKIKNTTIPKDTIHYEETDNMELNASLMKNIELSKDSSEDEQSDTQELFNVLRSHDR